MVYEDAEKLYAEVRKSGEDMINKAFETLLGAGNSALTSSTNLKALPSTTKIVGYNTTFFQRSDIVEVPLTGAVLSTPETGLPSWIKPASGVFFFPVFLCLFRRELVGLIVCWFG